MYTNCTDMNSKILYDLARANILNANSKMLYMQIHASNLIKRLALEVDFCTGFCQISNVAVYLLMYTIGSVYNYIINLMNFYFLE